MGDGEAAGNGKPRYRRVLLKLSGEALAPAQGHGIDLDALGVVAQEVTNATNLGIELALVIGGGNILRGSEYEARGMDRSTADQMGMLATAINALALQNALEQLGVTTRVLSAIEMQAVCEPYIRRRAVRHLEKGRAIIFAAGTGNPYFTTDTCAALRATELHADVLLKATKVDGIYTADPKKDKNAILYKDVSYEQVIRDELKVMDLTAFAMCKQQKIPL